MAKPLRPLLLSVKATNWRMKDDASASADMEFQNVREGALKRDDRTCQFCGFRATRFQEVHHLDDDHHNNDLGNLITACTFCHLCQHIGRAGMFGEGTLIYAPEISQARLHHIVRSIMVVKRWNETMATDTKRPGTAGAAQGAPARQAKAMASAALLLEAKLRTREADAQRLFKTSNASEFGTVLGQIANEFPALYDRRESLTRGLRLLPTGIRMENGANKMTEHVDSWMQAGGPYNKLGPREWNTLLSSFIPR